MNDGNKPENRPQSIDCAGDAVGGVQANNFDPAAGGSCHRRKFLEAKVVAVSYCAGRQQLTFIQVVKDSGCTQPLGSTV